MKNDLAGSLRLRDRRGVVPVTLYFLAPSPNIAVNISIYDSYGMDVTVIFDLYNSVRVV